MYRNSELTGLAAAVRSWYSSNCNNPNTNAMPPNAPIMVNGYHPYSFIYTSRR